MISRTEIRRNLRMLDNAYRREISNRRSLLIAKQALLELCGWIEESMDDICLRVVRRSIKDDSNYRKYRKKYVKTTHGFQYEDHFRKMLIGAIGMIGVEELESSVDQLKRDAMTSKLASLKDHRNGLAHTHIRNTTPNINAPSVTIADFDVIYTGLIEYQECIKLKLNL